MGITNSNNNPSAFKMRMNKEYYDKMSDEDKNILPLKRISFLGNNE